MQSTVKEQTNWNIHKHGQKLNIINQCLGKEKYQQPVWKMHLWYKAVVIRDTVPCWYVDR